MIFITSSYQYQYRNISQVCYKEALIKHRLIFAGVGLQVLWQECPTHYNCTNAICTERSIGRGMIENSVYPETCLSATEYSTDIFLCDVCVPLNAIGRFTQLRLCGTTCTRVPNNDAFVVTSRNIAGQTETLMFRAKFITNLPSFGAKYGQLVNHIKVKTTVLVSPYINKMMQQFDRNIHTVTSTLNLDDSHI